MTASINSNNRGYNRIVRLLILIGLLLLTGCGLWGGGVRSRAVAYYDFILGGSVTTNYSTFLSPAYRATFEPEALEELNRLMKPNMDSSERFKRAGPDDIIIETSGRYAFTYVKPELGYPYRSLDPVKWIKVGNRWYIYNGFTAEVDAYGHFPIELQLPEPPGREQMPTNLPQPTPRPAQPPAENGSGEADEAETESPASGGSGAEDGDSGS